MLPRFAVKSEMFGLWRGAVQRAVASHAERHRCTPKGAAHPAWSPDGQWIVFTSERNGSADLYRVKPDGTGLQRLTTNRAYEDQADVSPDGQKLAL